MSLIHPINSYGPELPNYSSTSLFILFCSICSSSILSLTCFHISFLHPTNSMASILFSIHYNKIILFSISFQITFYLLVLHLTTKKYFPSNMFPSTQYSTHLSFSYLHHHYWNDVLFSSFSFTKYPHSSHRQSSLALPLFTGIVAYSTRSSSHDSILLSCRFFLL